MLDDLDVVAGCLRLVFFVFMLSVSVVFVFICFACFGFVLFLVYQATSNLETLQLPALCLCGVWCLVLWF